MNLLKKFIILHITTLISFYKRSNLENQHWLKNLGEMLSTTINIAIVFF